MYYEVWKYSDRNEFCFFYGYDSSNWRYVIADLTAEEVGQLLGGN